MISVGAVTPVEMRARLSPTRVSSAAFEDVERRHIESVLAQTDWTKLLMFV